MQGLPRDRHSPSMWLHARSFFRIQAHGLAASLHGDHQRRCCPVPRTGCAHPSTHMERDVTDRRHGGAVKSERLRESTVQQPPCLRLEGDCKQRRSFSQKPARLA